MHGSYNYPKQLLSDYKSDIQDFSLDMPEEIRKCLNYILENLYEDSLTVSGIKSACKMNSNISGKFSIYTGFTPKQFIIHHRIEAGKVLLKKTSLNVAQICVLVGFSSHSAFCKTFKNNSEGIIPSVWRDENSGENSGKTSR